MKDTGLAASLQLRPTLPFVGVAYRLIHARYAATALSSIGSLRTGGRYNPRGAFEVLYLADSPVTALQEVEALVRTRAGLFPVKGPPRILLSVEATLFNTLDLTDPETQASLETNLQELTGDWVVAGSGETRAATQRLGEACYHLKLLEALKVPSARNPRAFNLAVFPDRLGADSSLRVFDESGLIDATLP
ncbi:hypothetical protein BH24DEI2_BH24DEI2_03160 [soil metagenome]